jgi:hypothetical protein
MTIRITIISIKTLNIMTLSIMGFRLTTITITTPRITIKNLKHIIMTLDTYTECHLDPYLYAEFSF